MKQRTENGKVFLKKSSRFHRIVKKDISTAGDLKPGSFPEAATFLIDR